MNYSKIYNQLIEKAILENRVKLKKTHIDYIYYERHHILPKSLNGSNDINNLVLLTAKEHYVAHKLLVEIYPGQKMSLAFHKMTYSKNGNHIKSNKDYEYARKLNSLAKSGPNHHMYGKKHSKETRVKMKKPHQSPSLEYIESLKELRKGKNNPMYGHVMSNESKEKISISNKGKKRSIKVCKQMSIDRKGRKVSEETKRKMSESQKGRPSTKKGVPLSEETKRKMSESKKGKNHNNYGKPSPLKGRKMSESVKKKMSESAQGRIPWNKGLKTKKADTI